MSRTGIASARVTRIWQQHSYPRLAADCRVYTIPPFLFIVFNFYPKPHSDNTSVSLCLSENSQENGLLFDSASVALRQGIRTAVIIVSPGRTPRKRGKTEVFTEGISHLPIRGMSLINDVPTKLNVPQNPDNTAGKISGQKTPSPSQDIFLLLRRQVCSRFEWTRVTNSCSNWCRAFLCVWSGFILGWVRTADISSFFLYCIFANVQCASYEPQHWPWWRSYINVERTRSPRIPIWLSCYFKRLGSTGSHKEQL